MSNIIWYNIIDFAFPVGREYVKYVNRPGFDTYSQLFRYFAANAPLIDRSNIIKLPVNVGIVNHGKLPKYVKFTKSLDQVCQETAKNLLDIAKLQGKKLALLYSGGIDSSLMLISFLKTASASDLKENIVVLLNNYSIEENPLLYYNYIVKQCNIQGSYLFTNYLGNPHYTLVSAEANDQLQGSSLFGEKIYREEGINKLLGPPSIDLTISSLNKSLYNIKHSEKIAEIFEKLVANATVPIETTFDYYWWIVFVLKWQCVITRFLANTPLKHRSNLQTDLNYIPFYQTTDHQLWSMNNPDKKIQSTWRSYKYHCKEIIFEFDKNTDYFKYKTKWGSGGRIMVSKYYPLAFTDSFKFYDNSYPEDFWIDENDFV